MSDRQPTNGELALMIDGLREIVELRAQQDAKAHKGVHKRLDELNGQVKKNSDFRNQATAIKGILGAIGLAVLGLIVDRITF